MRCRPLVLALAAALLGAASAPAAEPESGTVSREAPKTSWTGAVTSFQSWQTYNAGQGRCLPLSCDSFELEVVDGGLPLRVTVESGDSAIFVEVVPPSGDPQTFTGETKATGTIKNAPAGAYTINVAQNESTQATHKGAAELVLPPPAPAVAPPAPAAPAPASQAPAPKPAAKDDAAKKRKAKRAACRKKAKRIKNKRKRAAAMKRCARIK